VVTGGVVAGGVVTGGVVAGGVVTGGVVVGGAVVVGGGVVAGGVVGVAVGLVDGVGEAVGLADGLTVGLVDGAAGGGPMQVSVTVNVPSGATGALTGLSHSTVGCALNVRAAYPAVAGPAMNHATARAGMSQRGVVIRRYQGSGAACLGAIVGTFPSNSYFTACAPFRPWHHPLLPDQ
jgi:hypothetical protein